MCVWGGGMHAERKGVSSIAPLDDSLTLIKVFLQRGAGTECIRAGGVWRFTSSGCQSPRTGCCGAVENLHTTLAVCQSLKVICFVAENRWGTTSALGLTIKHLKRHLGQLWLPHSTIWPCYYLLMTWSIQLIPCLLHQHPDISGTVTYVYSGQGKLWYIVAIEWHSVGPPPSGKDGSMKYGVCVKDYENIPAGLFMNMKTSSLICLNWDSVTMTDLFRLIRGRMRAQQKSVCRLDTTIPVTWKNI